MNPARKPLIAGNWKMFHGGPSGVDLASAIAKIARATPSVDVLVAPPFTAIAAAAHEADQSPLLVGAQNMSAHAEGAHTGEISASMLKDAGAGWVILGHSERRALYGETDAIVADKTKAALAAGLSPIVCVGELLEEREAGHTLEVVGKQFEAVAEIVKAATSPLAIAYEPVWAIGTGKTAGPAEAEEVHAALRGWLGSAAERVRILYGGSVNASNAAGLLAAPNVDGALVGGASLKPESFGAIIEAAAKLVRS